MGYTTITAKNNIERKEQTMYRRILAINMNDFGGKTGHLMSYRYFNNHHINWESWANQVDKTETWEKWVKYIEKKKPDILIVEEMLVSSHENIDFIGEMEKMGYSYIKECLPGRGNYSLTMTFYKGKAPEYIQSPGDYRTNRSVICKDNNMLICGSHFPCESDETFLRYMKEFAKKNMQEDLLLIGDLNANDPSRGNKKMVNSLIEDGAVDLWIAAGNDENTPTEVRYGGRLDYAIASPSLAEKVEKIEIDPFPMETNLTDHAAIIVDIIS